MSRPLVQRVRCACRVTRPSSCAAIARRTWAFFETFVGPEDHWLPPDNYQEQPALGVAHRTSPTNIGLALLANLAAYDFGYISAGRLIERTANTLGTHGDAGTASRSLLQLVRHAVRCKPLPPAYVSTVDSGNLAGILLTLRQGLLAIPDSRIVGARLFEGLRRHAGACSTEAIAGTAPERLAATAKAIWNPPTIPGQPPSPRRGSGSNA